MYPVLFTIGSYEVRFYGLLIACGFLVGLYLAGKEAVRKGIGAQAFIDFAAYALISGILGARLYYVGIHYSDFLENPLDVFKIWEGGLAVHGGIIGGFFCAIWFCRKRKIQFWKFADAATPGIIIAQAIGRIGCFLNGCCSGGPANVPWAVTFTSPDSMASLNIPVHPTQLYEMGGNVLIFSFIWRLRRKRFSDGYIFLFYSIMYSGLRFILDFFRGDSLYVAGISFSWAQIMAIATLFFSLTCMYYLRRTVIWKLKENKVG